MKSVRTPPAIATAIAVGLFLLSASSSVAGTPTKIVGTRVTLDAPNEFAAAGAFPGIRSAEFRSSIKVTENSESISIHIAQYTKEPLAKLDIELLESREVKISGRDGRLLRTIQHRDNTPFEQW